LACRILASTLPLSLEILPTLTLEMDRPIPIAALPQPRPLVRLQVGPQMVSAAAALGQLRETKDALEGQLTEERALLAEFQRRTRDMKQRCAPSLPRWEWHLTAVGFRGRVWSVCARPHPDIAGAQLLAYRLLADRVSFEAPQAQVVFTSIICVCLAQAVRCSS